MDNSGNLQKKTWTTKKVETTLPPPNQQSAAFSLPTQQWHSKVYVFCEQIRKLSDVHVSYHTRRQ